MTEVQHTNFKEIDKLRKRIDTLDRALVKIFSQRVMYARSVGRRKRRLRLPLKDAERERRVIAQQVRRGQALGLAASAVRKFMTVVITASREAQKRV